MQTRQQPRATDAIATQQTNVIASAAAAAEAAFFRMPRPSVNNSAATRQRPRTADSARPGLSATGATLTTTRSNGSTVTPAPASPTSPRGYGYASGYGFVPVVVGGVVGGAGTSGLWSMPIGSFSMPDSRPAGSATAGKKKGDGEAPEEPEEEGGEKKNSRATGTRRTASLGRRHDRKAGEHHHAVLRKHPSKDVLAQLRALQEEQERRYLSLHERARRERVAEEVGDGQQQDQKNSSNRNSSTTLTNTTTDDFPSITNTTSAIAGKPGTRASIAVVESDSYRGHEDHEADEADDELGETIAAATSMPTGVPRGAARRGSMMFSLKRVFGSRKADVAV